MTSSERLYPGKPLIMIPCKSCILLSVYLNTYYIDTGKPLWYIGLTELRSSHKHIIQKHKMWPLWSNAALVYHFSLGFGILSQFSECCLQILIILHLIIQLFGRNKLRSAEVPFFQPVQSDLFSNSLFINWRFACSLNNCWQRMVSKICWHTNLLTATRTDCHIITYNAFKW